MFASHTLLAVRLYWCRGWNLIIGTILYLKIILLTVVSIHLYINHYSSPVIEKRSLEATLIIWFLGNCRATLRVLIPCAGIPLANMWCLSVKTVWRCGLWTMRALWMSLTAVGESSLHVLSILLIHPCLSLAVTRQVTFPCMSLLTVDCSFQNYIAWTYGACLRMVVFNFIHWPSTIQYLDFNCY